MNGSKSPCLYRDNFAHMSNGMQEKYFPVYNYNDSYSYDGQDYHNYGGYYDSYNMSVDASPYNMQNYYNHESPSYDAYQNNYNYYGYQHSNGYQQDLGYNDIYGYAVGDNNGYYGEESIKNQSLFEGSSYDGNYCGAYHGYAGPNHI